MIIGQFFYKKYKNTIKMYKKNFYGPFKVNWQIDMSI